MGVASLEGPVPEVGVWAVFRGHWAAIEDLHAEGRCMQADFGRLFWRLWQQQLPFLEDLHCTRHGAKQLAYTPHLNLLAVL